MDKEEKEAVQSVIEAKQLELAGEGIEKSIKTNKDNLQTKQAEEYGCGECDMKYRSTVDLDTHKTKVHIPINKERTSSLEWKMQEKMELSKSQVYKCDVCHKSCANQLSLKKHKMIHVQCDICEKTYYNSSSLKKHMVVHASLPT